MKILASAYACAPGWGSESGAGWNWSRAAAENNEVWVLTDETNAGHIEPMLERFPHLRQRLHPVYIRAPRYTGRAKANGMDRQTVRYVAWQAAARAAGERLHRDVGFDLAHHISWAVAWLPSGVSRIKGLPFVWGPVSGAGTVPRSLWRWLGARGIVQEAARAALMPAARALYGRGPLRRASLVLCQSPEIARWAAQKTGVPVAVEPLSAITVGEVPNDAHAAGRRGDGRTAVFAARALPWKGLRVAIAALARPEAADWSLDVFGAGPEIAPSRRLAGKLGLGPRVRFHGPVPRTVVMDAILGADALLNPSIHDSAPAVLAEAITVGCPVVVLDMGGMAIMATDEHGVRVPTDGDLVAGVASALARVPERFEPSTDWMLRRLPARLDDWYKQALGSSGAA